MLMCAEGKDGIRSRDVGPVASLRVQEMVASLGDIKKAELRE
jgi:hypothetical protein